MKPGGSVKNNSENQSEQSQSAAQTKDQTDQLKLKLKQLKDRQKLQQKQQPLNKTAENKSATNETPQDINQPQNTPTKDLEYVSQKLQMKKPQQVISQQQQQQQRQQQQQLQQQDIGKEEVDKKDPKTEQQPDITNKDNLQNSTEQNEVEPLQSRNLALLSPLLSKASAKITEDAVKQIDICKRLLNRQAELSKQLQSSQLGQQLANTSTVIQMQSYKQVTNLRPRSAEVPGMSFGYKRSQNTNSIYLQTQQVSTFKNQIEEDKIQMKNNLQNDNGSSDLKIDIEQIIRFQNIKNILNNEINQNTQLSDRILKQLNNHKKAGPQYNITNSKHELRMITSFKGNIKCILKVPEQQDEGQKYIVIENRQNKTHIIYEEMSQWIPFSVDAACTNVSGRTDTNQDHKIVLYVTCGLQIYVIQLGKGQQKGSKLLTTLPVGSGQIIKMICIQKFIQGLGNINVLLLWDSSCILHIFDIQKHELYAYRVPRPSAAISDTVYGQFIFCDMSNDIIAFASVSGLVGALNIVKILENSVESQRAQQDSLDALSSFQVSETLNGLFLIKNTVFVTCGTGKVLKFDKTQKLSQFFFRNSDQTEIQFPETISTALTDFFLAISGNLYDMGGNFSGTGQKIHGKWSRIDENTAIRIPEDENCAEVYMF